MPSKRIVIGALILVALIVAWIRVPAVFAERELRAARECWTLGLLVEADEHVAHAREWSPRSARVAFAQAQLYRKQGELNKVNSALEEAVKFGLSEQTAADEALLAQAQSGDLRKPMNEMSRLLLSSDLAGAEVCEAFVEGMLRTNRYPETEPLLQAWESENESDPRPSAYRGAMAFSQRDWGNSHRYWEQATHLSPRNARYHQMLGRTCLEQLQLKAAVTSLKRSVDLDRNPESMALLARAHQQLGKLDSAKELLDEILASDSPPVSALVLAGSIAVEDREYVDAIEWLESAVNREPWNLEARQRIGEALRLSGETSSADENQKEMAKIQAAIEEVSRLKDLMNQSPSDPELRYQLGMAYRICDAPSVAATWFQSVLQIKPAHRSAPCRLSEIYREMGQTALAEQFKERCSE